MTEARGRRVALALGLIASFGSLDGASAQRRAVVLPENPYLPPVAAAPRPENAPVVLPPNPYGRGNESSDHLAGRQYGSIPEERILAALRTAAIASSRNVGNTSVNLRCDLEGDIDGGYKPSEARHVHHWRAEIAAFRVNQLLGLERVPPALFRRVPMSQIPGGAGLGLRLVAGVSRGAMIYWVPVLHRSGIFSGSELTRWTNLLQVGTPLSEADRTRAEDISTLVVFDYLIGNWDRWHGTNTLTDGRGRMVYRDNNGGFLDPLPAARHEMILAFLQRVQRFSRTVIDRARALTLIDLQRAIAPDADGPEPLLSESQLRGVLRRRDTLVQYVDALVSIHGAEEVFYFP